MSDHPAVENLKDDLAMAALQNPHPDGSPEAEAYHNHIASMAKPTNMHRYLGTGVEEIIAAATKASSSTKQVYG